MQTQIKFLLSGSAAAPRSGCAPASCVFGTLFGLSLYRDIAAGQFLWLWGLAVFLICLPVGFELRKLVPMQVHLASRHITMSFDRLYFA